MAWIDVLQCETCPEMILPKRRGDDRRDVEAIAERRKWKLTRQGRWYCPTCFLAANETAVSPDTLRSAVLREEREAS